jgi:hypothetical protein
MSKAIRSSRRARRGAGCWSRTSPRSPTHDDDPGNIAATQQYLRDFNRLDETTATSRELFDAMMELHPDRANPGSLW